MSTRLYNVCISQQSLKVTTKCNTSINGGYTSVDVNTHMGGLTDSWLVEIYIRRHTMLDQHWFHIGVNTRASTICWIGICSALTITLLQVHNVISICAVWTITSLWAHNIGRHCFNTFWLHCSSITSQCFGPRWCFRVVNEAVLKGNFRYMIFPIFFRSCFWCLCNK